MRMALGADRGRVIGMVLRGAFLQVGVGLALGIPAAIASGRLMTTQLFGVKPGEPVMLTIAALLLSLAALLASVIPAWRAAGVEPSTRFTESLHDSWPAGFRASFTIRYCNTSLNLARFRNSPWNSLPTPSVVANVSFLRCRDRLLREAPEIQDLHFHWCDMVEKDSLDSQGSVRW